MRKYAKSRKMRLLNYDLFAKRCEEYRNLDVIINLNFCLLAQA